MAVSCKEQGEKPGGQQLQPHSWNEQKENELLLNHPFYIGGDGDYVLDALVHLMPINCSVLVEGLADYGLIRT